MISHSDVSCPICARVGGTVEQNCFITCPAYRALVHMAHCKECRYNRSECSIDWCGYKTKEQKLKERKEQRYGQRTAPERGA